MGPVAGTCPPTFKERENPPSAKIPAPRVPEAAPPALQPDRPANNERGFAVAREALVVVTGRLLFPSEEDDPMAQVRASGKIARLTEMPSPARYEVA